MIPICILAIEDESDREYMTFLFVQYQKLMYSTIEKIVQDHWLTEDTLQNVVEKLIDKISKLRNLDRTHLANYIITTCKNTAYNELRYKSRHPMFSMDEEYDADWTGQDDHSLEDRLIHEEDMTRLASVWDKLDKRSKYVLEARYILEKDNDEIARDLDVKAESVRMALTRARKKAYSLMTMVKV